MLSFLRNKHSWYVHPPTAEGNIVCPLTVAGSITPPEYPSPITPGDHPVGVAAAAGRVSSVCAPLNPFETAFTYAKIIVTTLLRVLYYNNTHTSRSRVHTNSTIDATKRR